MSAKNMRLLFALILITSGIGMLVLVPAKDNPEDDRHYDPLYEPTDDYMPCEQCKPCPTYDACKPCEVASASCHCPGVNTSDEIDVILRHRREEPS